ncbi:MULTISPECIES: hypothetical protein [Actinoalloteichus]|uniref:Uncharacterized protein n=1 Tax=Actinoalloteichus fjordicus TaxID=1612552 RepID=A0AAC9PTT3_9PSEU|nr:MULTISPECIES: hypothetical protein [Actinoalloteichus]APU16372.1 hypothetical protein UA74_21750 [Actinoalloteichus fjordicus]APU22430.1 hypothetical protein UA75_22220 [Actinoalloteichus sp. GBA129-24]
MTSQHTDEASAPGTYLGVMVIDTHRISAPDDVGQDRLTTLIPEIVSSAARRGGVERLLLNPPVGTPSGEGLLFGFDAELLPLAVDRLMDALQGELRTRARDLRADGITLRMRASLHLGPVPSFTSLFVDSPTGRVVIDSHRMVGAAEVRALLERSDPQATFLATVVSDAVMADVIQAGHTVRRPSEFVRTALSVAAEDFPCIGHLRVPVPSGELLTAGLLTPRQQASDAERPAPISTPGLGAADARSGTGWTSNTTTTNGGHQRLIAQSRDVGHIEDHSTAVEAGLSEVAVSGNNNNIAGRDLDQSTGRQDFSGTFDVGGDGSFGSHSGRRFGIPDQTERDS